MSTNERDLIVGGQAVIEGVMMRTPNAYAIAVRKADGTIVNTAASLPKWSDKLPILKLPVLRGGAVLLQSMGLGIKALNYSASEAFAEVEDAKAAEVQVALTPAIIEGEGDFAGLTGAVPGLFPLPTKKRSKDELKKGGTAAAASSIVFALIFNVLLFIAAPLLLTNALFIATGWATPAAVVRTGSGSDRAAAGADAGVPQAGKPALQEEAWYRRTWNSVRGYLHPVRPSISFNLVDGLIRMSFFLIMIVSFSLLKDIRRVFEYHGAEHKTVFTWEKGLALTVANARPQPRQHPRCGTSFLMVVMLVSIILFSVIKFDSLLFNFLVRIALIPVVAGLSYEIIRLSARKESGAFFKTITKPGVWLQNVTTKEPDDSQLEVAIEALKASLKLEPKPAEGEPVLLS
ncbi:MAG: hypothetical protein QOH70_1657 [Blastocatellia bacterium]|jgi:uncharacterized protein YqhQ|nr:hypothetical protein [Blastocatellia bacterium]